MALEADNYPVRVILTSGAQAIAVDYFIKNSDLLVTVFPVTGSSFVGAEGTDYSLSGAGDQDGGTVTTIGLTAGDTVVIERDLDFEQGSKYPTAGKFNESNVERDLDERTMEAQQNKGRYDRAIKIPKNETPTDAKTVLPQVSQRANKSFEFDAVGNPLMAVPSSGSGSSASSITYTPPGTGAEPRTQADFNQMFVNVLDFMTPAERVDVLTNAAALDVSQAIQDTIDFIDQIGKGGRVRFPMGTCNVGTKQFDISKKGIVLEGDSMGGVTRGTNPGSGILYTGTGMPFMITDNTSNGWGASLRRLRIDGNGTGKYGVQLGNGDGSPVSWFGVIEDLYITGFKASGGAAVRVFGSQGGVINRVYGEGNNHGITFDTNASNDQLNTVTTLNQCHFNNNEEIGMNFDHGEFIFLNGCVSQGNGAQNIKAVKNVAQIRHIVFDGGWSEANTSIADWLTATAYVIGDRVNEAGSMYRCLIAHNSGTFSTDLGSGNWVLVDIAARYGVHIDGSVIASFRNYFFRIDNASTNRHIFVRQGTMELENSFLFGNVSKPGIILVGTAEIQVKDASGLINYDDFLPDSGTAWTTATAFVFGDIVVEDSIFYHCKTAHTSDGTDFEADLLLGLWEVVGGQSYTFASWATATGYVLGDKVRNGSIIYNCVEIHTSGTFSTDLAADKWVEISPNAIIDLSSHNTQQVNGEEPRQNREQNAGALAWLGSGANTANIVKGSDYGWINLQKGTPGEWVPLGTMRKLYPSATETDANVTLTEFSKPTQYCDSTSNSVTYLLPSIGGEDGMEFTFHKKVAANSMILDGVDSQTINGATTQTYTAQYDTVTVRLIQNVEWIIVSEAL